MSIPSKPYSFIMEIAELMNAERVPGKRTILEKTSPPRSHPPTEINVFSDDFLFLRAVNLVQYSLSLSWVVVMVKSVESMPAKE
jgi:hypothetical protein